MSLSHEHCVDEKGRITIPESIRRSLHIESGETVRVTRENGRIVIEPQLAREAAVTAVEDSIFDGTEGDDSTPGL